MNSDKQPIASLGNLIGGAPNERFMHALAEAISNIQDLNTKPEAKRKITMTVSLTPNHDRDIANFNVEVKFAPVPRRPVDTNIYFGKDVNGGMVIRELTKQVPGQLDIDGNEEKPSNTLRLAPATSIK